MARYQPPNKRTLAFSDTERKATEFLIIDSDANTRSTLKQALIALGFSTITDASDHHLGLEKFKDRKITHCIFQAKTTNIPVKEFLNKILEIDPDVVALPLSTDPNVDDVFDLLILGAKGYIVRPFNFEGLDSAILTATKGEPLSPAILHAKDRNHALASFVLSNLDKVGIVKRQALQFQTAQRELPLAMNALMRSVQLAQTFFKGGEEEYRNIISSVCIDRANGPASKLGRARMRRKTAISKKSTVESAVVARE